MGLFKSTEQKAEEQRIREELKVQKAERKAREAWLKTPAGQANVAYGNGDKLFQFVDCIEATTGVVRSMMTAYAKSSDGSYHRTSEGLFGMGAISTESWSESKSELEKIETEGWHLVHAGYAFQEMGSESRDKFLGSGQNVAVSGRVIGIYIFRRVEN